MINNIDGLITNIYNNMVGIVLNGFDEKLKELVCKEYWDILNKRYRKFESSITDYNTTYDKLYKMEKLEWSEMPLGMKKNLFLKDEKLNRIIDIASIAYKCAVNRLNNNEVVYKDQAEDLISELEKLGDEVFEYNKDLATWYISESIMDLKYSSGQTNNTSLRIGHLK